MKKTDQHSSPLSKKESMEDIYLLLFRLHVSSQQNRAEIASFFRLWATGPDPV
jgi:hypothetical protein